LPVIEGLQRLGRATLFWFNRLGRATLFLLRLLGALAALGRRPGLIAKQLYSVGVLSLPIIAMSGLFVGMVLGLQGYANLVDFGATSSLGTVVALSLVRELGPVLAALLYAARAGSALTAEIGLMKATEQLTAMLCLACIFTAIGILGGYFVAVQQLGVDSGAFWSQMQAAVRLVDDVINGVVVKSVVFGWVANWIAVFEGYDAIPTSEGISLATTRTVVNTALVVLALDFVLTAIFFGA